MSSAPSRSCGSQRGCKRFSPPLTKVCSRSDRRYKRNRFEPQEHGKRMSFEQIIAFALGMFVLALAPGPGVAAVVARALSGGVLAAMAVTTGLVIGDVVFMALA